MSILSWPWVWDAYQTRLETHDASSSLSCMLVNSAWWNDRHQAVADAIIEADPDLVVILEIHPELRKILRGTKKWSHNYGRSRIGPYSQVILSKYRLLKPEQHAISGAERHIDVQDGSGSLVVKSMLVYDWVMHIPNSAMDSVLTNEAGDKIKKESTQYTHIFII